MTRKTIAAVLTMALMASIGLAADPARAADGIDVVGRVCAGVEVPRCVELHYDWINHNVRIHASIIDNGNGNQDYEVAVNRIGFDSHGVDAYLNDYDGYHPVYDTGMSRLVDCIDEFGPFGGRNGVAITFTATFSWRGPKSDSQTLTSTSHRFVCKDPYPLPA